MPAQPHLRDGRLHPFSKARRHGVHSPEGGSGQNFFQGGPHGGHGEGVARQGTPDAADVAILDSDEFSHPGRHLRREAVGGGGDAGADGFAQHPEIRGELPLPRAAAGAGADGVGLV